MIDETIKKLLDEQQSEIINDDHKYLCISACPGAGKTYTLVQKMNKELETLKDFQGVIACSFTREASKEIKERISRINKNIDNCYIETLDSFVMNLIVRPFLNRYLLNKNKFKHHVEITSVLIDNDNNLNKYIRFFDSNNYYKSKAIEYANKWFDSLLSGKYFIAYPSYILAAKIIEMKLFNDYFSIRFPTIYIDEAQDLNYFQHELLKALKKYTDINIVLFGDPNQSIYQFRGARPELFNALYENGYFHKSITVSVRCHPSILYYANKIFNFNLEKNFVESKVELINEISNEILNKLEDGVFILTETKNKAIELYEEYKEDYDILYSKRLEDMPNDYNLNQQVLDELIKYYVNYDNDNDRYKYPVEKLLSFLYVFSNKLKEKQFKIGDKTFIEFMRDSIRILNLDVSLETIDEIETKLQDEKYMYHYYVIEKENKIMTIHSSKGLESNNVIVVLDNSNQVDEVFKNKLFVAMTRARKKVYILCKNSVIRNYIENLIS